MDIKIAGITEEIMKVALGQAKDGRIHILGEMAKALTNARAELGEYAPRIETFKIPTDKIREVIGTGGKVIREIVEKTGAKVNIEDDGTVKVASADGESIKAAIKWIKSIASDPELGQIYDGTVVKVMEFGAFVNFFGAKDGLVHISQLAANRVQKTSDVVKEGDKVKVKLLGFDDRGKTRLSMKAVDQATGEDLEAKQKAEGRARSRRRVSIATTGTTKGGFSAALFVWRARRSHLDDRCAFGRRSPKPRLRHVIELARSPTKRPESESNLASIADPVRYHVPHRAAHARHSQGDLSCPHYPVAISSRGRRHRRRRRRAALSSPRRPPRPPLPRPPRPAPSRSRR